MDKTLLSNRERIRPFLDVCTDYGRKVEEVGENSYIADCGEYFIAFSLVGSGKMGDDLVTVEANFSAVKDEILNHWKKENTPGTFTEFARYHYGNRYGYKLGCYTQKRFHINFPLSGLRNLLLFYDPENSYNRIGLIEMIASFGYKVEEIGENSYTADNGIYFIPFSFSTTNTNGFPMWSLDAATFLAEDKDAILETWSNLKPVYHNEPKMPIGKAAYSSHYFNEYWRGVGFREEEITCIELSIKLGALDKMTEAGETPDCFHKLFESHGYKVIRNGINDYIAENDTYFIPFSVKIEEKFIPFFMEIEKKSKDKKWVCSAVAFRADFKEEFFEYCRTQFTSSCAPASSCARYLGHRHSKGIAPRTEYIGLSEMSDFLQLLEENRKEGSQG